jgi:hypothetical protein
MVTRCSACQSIFTPKPQTPHQKFCSKEECQRARQRQWRKSKRETDPDYRANQAKAQRSWAGKNRDYWRAYRQAHPDYAESNRQSQHGRNQLRRAVLIAKSNASPAPSNLPEGLFELRALDSARPCRWIVRLSVMAVL